MFFETNGIHTYYGKSHILHGVSIGIDKGEIVALLGRNGVGKSTFLKSIMGLVPPQKGSVRFQGQEMIGWRPHRICRAGIGYVPEERRIFPTLTVRQNLLVGVKTDQKVDNPWTVERIYEYFPQLEKRAGQKGGHLSGGEQQMLTIGRTLMGNPEVLLVDEPTEGLAPLLVQMVVDVLRGIHNAHGSILLVEQALDVTLSLAGRVYLMSKGEMVFDGKAAELQNHQEVIKKYLEV